MVSYVAYMLTYSHEDISSLFVIEMFDKFERITWANVSTNSYLFDQELIYHSMTFTCVNKEK